MKEQIIEILESDYCDGGPTIGSIADKIIELISAEVERRIAERLPSDEDKSAEILVSGSAWDLPDGVYQVGVDKAAKGSKDYSTRIWMEKGIRGEIVIVAEERYRSRMTEGGKG